MQAGSEKKKARQTALLEAISRKAIGTQHGLAAALKRMGVRATQASLSRDIAELGIVKSGGRYAAPRAAGAAAADWEMPIRSFVRAALPAGPNLVVLRCATGTAQQVGLALDRLGRGDLAGTIAGDDTVFAAVPSKKAAESFVGYIQSRIAP